MESYLTRRVPDLVARELGGGREQIPWIVRSGSGTGDMVLSWATKRQPNASRDSEEMPKDPKQYEELEWEPIGNESEQEGMFERLDWEPLNAHLRPLTQQEISEGWVDATGECRGVEIEQEEAQRNALEQARRIAIEIAMEEEMDALEFLMRSNSLQDFQQSLASLSRFDLYGKIVDEKTPVWSPIENIQFRPGRSPVLVYRVKLRAKIAKEKSQPDPGFAVSLKPNNGIFKDGEEMILFTTPTQDCYVTVFKLSSDGTVLILDPPRAVPGGRTFSLPTEKERQSGRSLRVSLLSGKPEIAESVFVIATKDSVSFQFEGEPGGKVRSEIFPTYQSALEEICRWLMSIPLEKRTFDIQEYKIRKK